jgi:hypothetical protein
VIAVAVFASGAASASDRTDAMALVHQTKWFNEFLASYVGYAYLKTKVPSKAFSSEIFWTVGLGNSPHTFTKLDDFESKYDQLQEKYPGNYGWYQLALDQRVRLRVVRHLPVCAELSKPGEAWGQVLDKPPGRKPRGRADADQQSRGTMGI